MVLCRLVTSGQQAYISRMSGSSTGTMSVKRASRVHSTYIRGFYFSFFPFSFHAPTRTSLSTLTHPSITRSHPQPKRNNATMLIFRRCWRLKSLRVCPTRLARHHQMQTSEQEPKKFIMSAVFLK